MQKKRDYKKEYREYHGKASQIKDRAFRAAAKAQVIKKNRRGKARK